MFHKMTLEGKSTTHDFYSSLEKLSDNTGCDRRVSTRLCFRFSVNLATVSGPLQGLSARNAPVSTFENAHAGWSWERWNEKCRGNQTRRAGSPMPGMSTSRN